ncbi:MAG: hypothetical protein A3K19_02840 [Lentisphaerae bacterium RIFOXYB12_FULL_65_16]|nr:MAG: hypothetical protein A3K18_19890 [Lentisphaerae bacterium RIFOXYA12_64_32]OGV92288.1 MAG: hypothetical protein A3K19_02840 [Lentisphaerae bacterium RIFOXYB12_FULL_65_16]
MFKLPSPPSPEADSNELADFVELLSWDAGSASKREVVACLGRVDDNDNNAGCDDDDDENSAFLDEVMNEIERRASACGGGYPFRLDHQGTVLRHEAGSAGIRSVLYRYLLLGTRLNMKDNRIHAGIDGANLLEEVAANVLRNYLGYSRAHTSVFGTSVGGTFQAKIERLCAELHEGVGFESLDDAPVDANDDKLDAVAWVPFSDLLPGQLIVFGQCKTGSNWGGLTTQLQPDAFIKKWMKGTIVVSPIRAFCISEAADRARWKGKCTEAGILLDRCRLVDFCDNLTPDLVDKISHWTNAAKSASALPRLDT